MYKYLYIICISMSLSACATTREVGTVPDAYDPLESFNRDLYSFNETANDYVFSPIIKGYNWIIPEFIRNRIVNFFNNLDEGTTFVNSLLQAKFENAGLTLSRFIINSSLGIGGLFDVSTDMGIENKSQDFGMTLETYGIAEGPIITVPFLYPMSTRDVIGEIGDIFLDPVRFVVSNVLEDTSSSAYWIYYGTNIFTTYADKKDYLDNVKTITLDPYSAMVKYGRLSRHAKFDDKQMSEMKLLSGEQSESISYDFDFETEYDTDLKISDESNTLE